MMLMQATTVAAQIIVGNLLKEEYALNMIIVSIMMIASLLRDAGLRRIAIAAGADGFPKCARQLQQLTWILNISVTLLLVALIPTLVNHVFEEPQPRLRPMLWVLVATFAISPLTNLQWAKLAIDLRFRTISLLNLSFFIVRNVTLITLAVLGYKEMALVMPWFVATVFDCVVTRFLTGPLPPGPSLNWRTAWATLMTSRWIMLMSLGTIVMQRSDTFCISRTGDFETAVTHYGFALTLVLSALTPFTYTMQQTLMPVFVRLVHDPERLGNAYQRVIGIAAVVGAAAWLPAVLASPSVMHMLWGGKWDVAAPIVVVLMCTLVPKSLQGVSVAIDEARGRFKSAALLLTVDGATTAAFALAGALHGNALLLAAAISVHHLGYCLYHVLHVGRDASRHDPEAIRHLLGRIAWPSVAAVVALGTALAASRVIGHGWWPGTHWIAMPLAAGAMLLYAALIGLLRPLLFRETLDLFLRRGRA